MIHQRQRLALGLEPGDDLFRVHAQLDDLEGHPAADRLLLFGHIDHSAAAFANLLEEFVTPDTVAGLFGGRAGEAHGRARDLGPYRGALGAGRRGFEEGAGCFMIAEQGLQAQAQRGIIGTSLIQIGSTLAGGQLQGRAKEGHFPIGRRVHGRLNTHRAPTDARKA